MVDHLGGCVSSIAFALLTHGILLQLHGTQPSPGRTLVELCVVVAVASERLALGLPRAVCPLLNRRHHNNTFGSSGSSAGIARTPFTLIIFDLGNF